MKKKFYRLKNWFDSMESLQERLFWILDALTVCMGIASVIMTAFESSAGSSWDITMALIASTLTVIIPVIIGLLCLITGKVGICYFAFTVLMSCVVLPITFFACGGTNSGMPIFCTGILLLCVFCETMKQRVISSVLAICINVGCIIFEKFGFVTVNPIADGFIHYDIALAMALIGAGEILVCSSVFLETKKYAASQKILNKYMDENVRETLIQKEQKSDFEHGNMCNFTVMFADISRFSTITEGLAPEEAFEYLNEFLKVATKCIHDNGGTIDKYIGDCVMAYWQDKKTTGYGVFEACRAAMDIRQQLSVIADHIQKKYRCELDFSCGINYGPAMLGEIGSSDRRDYTIIGNAVNVAEQLCAAAPKGYFYVSRTVRDILGRRSRVEKVTEKLYIKGKVHPLDAFYLARLGQETESHSPKDMENGQIVLDSDTGYVMYISGCRGSYSVSGLRYEEFGGETSCYVIKKGAYALVIDCGSGLYNARELLSECADIDVILTHLHYDHILGLLDWSIFPKESELRIYGNFDAWLKDESIKHFLTAPYWPVDLSRGTRISINYDDEFRLQSDINVRFYPADHPNASSLAVIDISGHKICIMADNESPDALPSKELRGCDILLFDGMYENCNYETHRGWGHSTWETGVGLAIKENVTQLIITHHNPDNSDEKLRGLENKARLLFNNTRFARAGDAFKI